MTRTVLMQLLTSRLPAAFLLRLCEYLTAQMLDVLDMNYAITSTDLRPSTLSHVSLPLSNTRAGRGRVYAPTDYSEMLPHNWAMLFRRGPGLTALLRLWVERLRHMRMTRQQPDDQWALALTLRWLRRTGGCADALRGGGGSHACKQRVRIWRLRETFAGFKSADKRRLGFFPRYLRPLVGPVLATHSLTPFPWPSKGEKRRGASPAARNACALLNARVSVPRLALLASKRSGYRVVSSASECNALLRELAPARAARIAAPICSMLRSIDRTPADAVTTTVPLAESLDEFFRFLKSSSRAPHIHHETAVAPPGS